MYVRSNELHRSSDLYNIFNIKCILIAFLLSSAMTFENVTFNLEDREGTFFVLWLHV